MNYLYFILPPVIIVVVTAFIFYLLSRKSFGEEKNEKEKNSIKIKSGASKASFVRVQEGFLDILEKKVQGLKEIFAKLHEKIVNILSLIKKKAKKRGFDHKKERDFFQERPSESLVVSDKENGIKEKTNSIVERKENKEEEEKTQEHFKRKEKGIIRKSWRQTVDFSRNSRKLKKSGLSQEEKKESEENARIDDKKERNEAPMVSKEIVYPEAKIEREKNENIEKLLVERIAADPRDVEAYEQLGNYYEERKSYDDALSCFKYALKLNPKSKRAERKVMKIQDLLSR